MASVRKERRQVNGKQMLAEALANGRAALVSAVSQHLNDALANTTATVLGARLSCASSSATA